MKKTKNPGLRLDTQTLRALSLTDHRNVAGASLPAWGCVMSLLSQCSHGACMATNTCTQ